MSSKRLEGVPVMTKAGQRLGRLVSLELDADTGKLTAITVRPQGVVTALLGSDLLITWGQVVEMSEERVIVQEAVVPVGSQTLAAAPPSNV